MKNLNINLSICILIIYRKKVKIYDIINLNTCDAMKLSLEYSLKVVFFCDSYCFTFYVIFVS